MIIKNIMITGGRIFIAVVIILFLSFCNGPIKRWQPNANFISDSVKLEIPLTSRGEYDGDYTENKKIATELGLDYLEDGVDSLQIRIWLECDSRSWSRIVVLSNRNGGWDGEIFDYGMRSNDNGTFELVTGVMETLTPKSGWNFLIDSLIKLRLIELPDINDVPGMISFGLHGNRFALEIASRHNYKFCNYSNLDYYLVRNEWPASNMAKAIKLISDECGFSCFPTR